MANIALATEVKYPKPSQETMDALNYFESET